MVYDKFFCYFDFYSNYVLNYDFIIEIGFTEVNITSRSTSLLKCNRNFFDFVHH